ncbi:predicted protein [Thalassiosira pseudonana CCMP1335]|uniref:3-hydroxyisobutyryl-coenzyme A hydrolase n=1 Tax=Thalassiosira pseudonana TaxID=35128 RepID=B8LDQ6_THAPS|nr:predicted protein [Thalassiosira pseudonana CCMP1335]EED86480.1 predicted protein [Thalassiosira pseudonana CCMP1335]
MMYSSTTRCLAASKWHPSSAGSARRLSVVTSLMYPSASARHHYRFVSLSLYKPQVICPITTFNAIVQRSHSSSSLNEQPPSATYSKLSNTTIQAITTTSKTDDETRVKILPLGDGIVHVLLSRPKKMNSLDMSMFESIAEAAMMLKEDRDVRVVIVSGEGRAFCTGLDAKSVALSGPTKSLNRLLERPSGYGGECGLGNLAQDVGYLWRQLPVPVIAVLHGMCFGGGMQLALGADMRFSTPDCRLSIMEARWGLIPDMSASITLRELVRIDVAKELTMTGRIISGLEGEKIGLVTRCVDQPMEEAMKVAKEIVESLHNIT